MVGEGTVGTVAVVSPHVRALLRRHWAKVHSLISRKDSVSRGVLDRRNFTISGLTVLAQKLFLA